MDLVKLCFIHFFRGISKKKKKIPGSHSMTNSSLAVCGGLTLAEWQAPTKSALSLCSTAGQGRGNVPEVSWVEERTTRDYPPSTIMGKARNLGKLIGFVNNQNQSRIMRNKPNLENIIPTGADIYPAPHSKTPCWSRWMTKRRHEGRPCWSRLLAGTCGSMQRGSHPSEGFLAGLVTPL